MTQVRRVSKALFGNADRLEVINFIASSTDGLVYATEISESLRIPQNRARAQLMALAEAGLLESLPRDGGRAFFLRKDHSLWSASQSFFDSLAEASDSA